MPCRLYNELASWYRLIDPPENHSEEMLACSDALARAGVPGGTLLELGSGAGHNALHLSQRFQCTLSDVSASMLALSRELNPSSEHVEGDMRTLRLGRTFDAVVIHDSICHMTSRRDLQAALETAFVHLRPGGAAIFSPDSVRESFGDYADSDEASQGDRAVSWLEWSWDPDPSDEICRADYAFMLRDGNRMRVEHDSFIEGLFSRQTWLDSIRGSGFAVETFKRPVAVICSTRDELVETSGPYTDDVFLGRKP
jgi:SAM-dependent methyltransferase